MESPSARIVASAARETAVRDAAGRSLVVRQVTALDRLRLFKALGAALAENPPYLGMAVLAVSVTSIDGVPVPASVTEAQVEALVQRLGDVGIAAAAEALDAMETSAECSDPGN